MQSQTYPRPVFRFGGIVIGVLLGFGIGYAVWAVRAQNAHAQTAEPPFATTGASAAATPGNCITQEACRAYCIDQNHTAECRTYGYQYLPQGFLGSMVIAVLMGLGAATQFLLKLFT